LLADTSLSLSDFETVHYQAEMEFLLGADNVDVLVVDDLIQRYSFAGQNRPRLLANQINGLLKGFIDLLFVHNDQYYVLDYKFNALGNSDADYTQQSLDSAMLSKRYDLQAVLYLLALHRLLKTRLGDVYDYDSHIGGYVYLFLRGAQSATAGRMFAKPPKVLIESLDALFCNTSIQGEQA
jgi:exodeoxyribonuclease V beta subunit